MRFGGVLSVAIHVGLAAAGLIVAPSLAPTNPTPFMILPVELLEVSDSTNVIPVTEDAKEDEKADVKEEIAEPAAAAAPPPAPDDVALPSEDKPEPKKPESKKPEAETPPAKPKEQDFKSALQGILSDVKREDRSPQRSASSERPTNLNTVNDAGPRTGAGDMKRMTMTVADAIRSQLLSKGCWTDQDDMADARRLKAVIAVRFGRDGHIQGEMKLIEPTREPSNDPPLQVFVSRARTALNKCNNMGFQVPAEYFKSQPPQIIELEFLP